MGWGEVLFSSETSPLNVRAHGQFYVYGDLPLTAQSILAYAFGATDYADIMGLVRAMSALMFAAGGLAVSLTALAISGRADAALLAGVIYALSPTVFQIAGFGTVDVWLVAFWAWAGFGMVLLVLKGSGRVAVWTGLCLAAALSAKPTGALLVLPALATSRDHRRASAAARHADWRIGRPCFCDRDFGRSRLCPWRACFGRPTRYRTIFG